MSKNKLLPQWLFLLLVVGFIIVALVVPGNLTYGSPGKQITVPTRTPDPGPGEPTNTPDPGPGEPTNTPDPGGGGGGGGTSEATPVATTIGSTATVVSTPATAVPTPLGGYLPTAQACDTTPTVRSTGNVFVRRGPGTNYEAVTSLQYLEVRPIRGRAANAEWWLIELGDGTLAWVANLAIQVQGYTGLVPVAPPPALPNGSTPTPGPLWNPTPNPVCTVVPTATPTATPTGTLAASPTASATATATSTSTPAPSPTSGLSTLEAIATNTVPAAASTVVPTAAPPTPAITAQTLTPTVTTATDNSSAGSNTILFAGIGLILTAGIVAFATRRRV
jgi:hypothetical protein